MKKMKKIQIITAIAVLILTGIVVANAQQTARLQVIHNAADPGASLVDVYVNDDLFIDDFAFRAATPFVDVPAGVELSIGVAPSNSNSVDDVIASFPVTFMDGETYVAIANGVLTPGDFADNPDGLDIGFTLYAQDGISESSGSMDVVKVIAFHGATDAPEVDIYPLYNGLVYGSFSEYAEVPPDMYVLEVRPAGNPNSLVEYNVDLSGLGGGAAVAFASGFLNPDNNQGGPAFGLFAALPDGQVVEFPVRTNSVEEDEVVPNKFGLNHNYPNPFNPATSISFNLPTSSDVVLKVYNVAGQEVATLVDNKLSAGEHDIQFDGGSYTSGVYFYRLTTDNYSDTKKMTLLK
jgi:hypothetical protein